MLIETIPDLQLILIFGAVYIGVLECFGDFTRA